MDWDGWKMVWKWISCIKSNWKPSGGPQGLILEPILLSVFGRTEQNRPSAGHSWMWRGWGQCTFWMPGCLLEVLKKLEKWAAENQWISKASANFCIWKRTAPRSHTGWPESSSAERKQNLKSPGWQQVEDVISQSSCSRDSLLHAGLC